MKKKEMAMEKVPSAETPKERAMNKTRMKEQAGSTTWANSTATVFWASFLTVFIHPISQ